MKSEVSPSRRKRRARAAVSSASRASLRSSVLVALQERFGLDEAAEQVGEVELGRLLDAGALVFEGQGEDLPEEVVDARCEEDLPVVSHPVHLLLDIMLSGPIGRQAGESANSR